MNKYNTVPFATMGNKSRADENEEGIDLEDALLQKTFEEERAILPPNENDDYSQKVRAFVAGETTAAETPLDDTAAMEEAHPLADDDEDGVARYDIDRFRFDQKELVSFLRRIGSAPLERAARDQICGHLKEIEKLIGVSYRREKEKELLTLYADLVPPDGPAETVAGEIIRAVAEVRFIVDKIEPDVAESPAATYLADNVGETARGVIADMRDADGFTRTVVLLPLLFAAVIDYIHDNPWLKEVSNKTDFGQMHETEETQTEQEDESDDQM